jgi:hypothetical protein
VDNTIIPRQRRHPLNRGETALILTISQQKLDYLLETIRDEVERGENNTRFPKTLRLHV